MMARADFSEGIRLDPKYGDAYFLRFAGLVLDLPDQDFRDARSTVIGDHGVRAFRGRERTIL